MHHGSRLPTSLLTNDFVRRGETSGIATTVGWITNACTPGVRAQAARRSDYVTLLRNLPFHVPDLPDSDAIAFEAAEISRRKNAPLSQVGHHAPPFRLGVFGQPAGCADHGVKVVATGR
jgi:hypothetical protein